MQQPASSCAMDRIASLLAGSAAGHWWRTERASGHTRTPGRLAHADSSAPSRGRACTPSGSGSSA
jgi:hypothetical protein